MRAASSAPLDGVFHDVDVAYAGSAGKQRDQTAVLEPEEIVLTEGGAGAKARRGDVDEPSQRLAREIHRPHVPPAHDGVEFVVWNAHHQVASDDTAAHPAQAEEGKATEHLPFGDVVSGPEGLANAIGQRLVVGHRILRPSTGPPSVCRGAGYATP